MQRRRSERIPVNLSASIMLGDATYDGLIINVSEDGVGSAITSEIDSPTTISPLHHITVQFQLPSGTPVHLLCELAWFSKRGPDEARIVLGLKITECPEPYQEFISTLYGEHLRRKTPRQLIADILDLRRKLAVLYAQQSGIAFHEGVMLGGEDTYRSLVESTDDSIYIIDSANHYRFMNQIHQARLGLQPGTYAGRLYSDFHSPEETRAFLERAQEVYRSGSSVQYEHDSTDDGKHFLRTISPIFDERGHVRAVTVISKNITDRKLAEEILKNSNLKLEEEVRKRTADLLVANENLNREIAEKLQTEKALTRASSDWRLTFDSTRDMMLLLDERFRVVKVNKAITAFLDLPFSEIIGKDFFQLFDDMDLTAGGHPLERLRASRDHEESEIFLKRREMWVLCSADPILGDGGQMEGAVHVMRDITDQKNLQMQLLQAQKMESIGRLAGGVAHDFNNILSSIIGYAELSLMKLSVDDPLREYLQTIKEAGDRAAVLTRRLLAFSRKQMLQMRSIDLNELLDGMVKMMSRMVREDITLELHKGSSLHTVLADPSQIEQVIMNLIVNARDAMPDGGKLIIETENALIDEHFIVRHEEVVPGSYVRLSVTDTGIGMSRKVQDRIFEPFFTTKPVGSGTGLGLSMVYGTVRQHNGYVYVYSEVDKGTTFKIYLPVADNAVESASCDVPGELRRGSERILVVDDDPSIRNLVRDILLPLGYRLSFADSGEEALRIISIADAPFDLVLTDVIMPQMNGRQLAGEIRKSCQGVRIIFMSGYTDETIAREDLLTHHDMLIQKPLTAVLLTQALRRVLDAA